VGNLNKQETRMENMETESIQLHAEFLASLGPKKYKARFVRAGRVRRAGNQPSRIVVQESALKEAVAARMFDDRAVFVDHAGFFDYPSMRNLVGVTRSASYDDHEKAVIGEIGLYSIASEIAALIDEILAQRDNAPDVGLSIVFWPVWAEDSTSANNDRSIIAIKHVESVDLVFEPAADGRILQALSALRVNHSNGGSQMTDQPNNRNQAQAPSADDLAQMWMPVLAKNAAAGLIANSGLPTASRDKLLAMTFMTPAEVQKAIEDERSYLARLAEAGVIHLGGTAPRERGIQVGMDGVERIRAALEALLLGRQPGDGIQPLSGIREAYTLLSGDYEMTGMFHPERVYLASVNSSTMAGMVANALNKVVVNEFQMYPRWWEKIATVQDFTSLQQAKFITLGGIGELPTVAEGAAYTEMAWDDQTETADFVKKGGYLGITIEAIDKDDTRRLQAAPRALAQAAWLTLSKSISNIFTSNSGVGPTLSDSVALFDAGHANLGSTALSLTSWVATRTAMRKQTELNSGERLGALVAPKYLLVPPDLEVTALQVLGSESDYTYALSNGTAAPTNVEAQGNFHDSLLANARERVIGIDLWTDTNNWAAVADPRLYPSIGLGFRYGRTPEIFSVASPTAGLMFSNDTMPVKVRFFFAVGPTDYRGLYKHNVA
jgi:hypothetical protein